MQFAKNLSRFRLVSFDITDTLLKFKNDPIKIYAQTACQFGYKDINEKELGLCFRENFKAMSKIYPNFGAKNPDITWQQWWLQLVKKTFCSANPNIDEKNLDLLAEHLLKIFRTKECWEAIEGSENLLQKVKQSGVCIGCISNFDPSLRLVLEEMNILQHFDFIVTSYEAKIPKPEKEIFDLALQCVGNVKACEALHIGNSFELDFMGAQNAGWSSLLVTKEATKISGVEKDFVYVNLCDMLKALETNDIKW